MNTTDFKEKEKYYYRNYERIQKTYDRIEAQDASILKYTMIRYVRYIGVIEHIILKVKLNMMSSVHSVGSIFVISLSL